MRLARRSFLAAATLAPIAARAAPPDLPGRVIRHADFKSRHVAPRHIEVWLPEGYDEGAVPHRLLVMHDGQNLFDPANSEYSRATWRIAETLTELNRAGAVPPTIVVGVWSLKDRRWREYMPLGLFDRAPQAMRDGARRIGQVPISDRYLAFVTQELMPFVRDRYRVTPGPAAVMGSSMGGLISLAMLAEHGDMFDRAGCMSIHWPLINPEPRWRGNLQLAIDAYLRERLGAPAGRRVWFDHGTKTLDEAYAPFQSLVDQRMATLGWRRGVDWETRVYPGAEHSEPAWAARAADPLRFLLG